MRPDEYDGWYNTPRGRWVGETEFQLLHHLLDPSPDDSVLDVGCGTGWFTRQFSALSELYVTGIDPNAEWLTYARMLDNKTQYIEGDGCALPFADKSFDRVVSVTALCFIRDWQLALHEIVRVTRTRFTIGVLNRRSLLWYDKGQGSGKGAYRGAHWHTKEEILAVLDSLNVANLSFHTAVFMPSGSRVARCIEYALPNSFPFGGFLVVTGDVMSANNIMEQWVDLPHSIRRRYSLTNPDKSKQT
jgi:SAM-dependent methyltransferase